MPFHHIERHRCFLLLSQIQEMEALQACRSDAHAREAYAHTGTGLIIVDVIR